MRRSRRAGAAAWCARRGGLFIETSVDPRVAAGLLAGVARDGGVLVGAGLFPALSNLLAREVVRASSGCDGVELGVRIAPFSGAGRSMCGLMTTLIAEDARWREDGAEVRLRPLSRARAVAFPGGSAAGRAIWLAEGEMLPASLGLKTVRTLLAVRPSWANVGAGLASPLLAARGPRRLAARIGRPAVIALRAGALRRAPTSVEICARALRRGEAEGAPATLRTADGAGATAAAAAAMAILAVGRRSELVGANRAGETGAPEALNMPEQLFTLSEVVRTMQSVWRGVIETTGTSPACTPGAARP